MDDARAKRRLPKSLRRANLVYQIIMALIMPLTSLLLAIGTDVNELYFQITSFIVPIIPVIWSNILDACKKYEEEQTPEPSPERSDSTPLGLRASASTPAPMEQV